MVCCTTQVSGQSLKKAWLCQCRPTIWQTISTLLSLMLKRGRLNAFQETKIIIYSYLLNVNIYKAGYDDLNEILQLQYLAYQSEAALFGTKDIPPLTQTIEDVIDEYNAGIVLKMVSEDNKIIGSIRAKEEGNTVYISKLMIHSDYRRRGYGTRLLTEIENHYPGKRYELFTSTRSSDNIRLYQTNGYQIFSQKAITEELIFVYMEKLPKA